MSEITMYGAEWCGDCRRSKRFLDSNSVTYNYIDVEADASASEKVIEINGGINTEILFVGCEFSFHVQYRLTRFQL